MNKIVKVHYPAARLPADLQQGLDPASRVTVTIEPEPAPARKVMSLEEIFAARRPPYRSADEIDAEIRRSRNEWND